jgi:hypothetical protein
VEERHVPPMGQSLIGLHRTSKDCICKPSVVKIRKRQTSGRGGSGQGYKIVRTDVIHEVI